MQYPLPTMEWSQNRKDKPRRIGVLNYKGGTGKTTTVVNLGAGLAMRGARVLCIDLDPQGSLAMCLGVRYTHSLAGMLMGKAEPRSCVVRARHRLDIIAGDRNLIQAEGAMWRMNDNRLARHLLTSKMRGLEERYDYVILDFSPSASILSESGLQYIRELVVPVAMSYMALIGTRQVIETLKSIGRMPEHALHQPGKAGSRGLGYSAAPLCQQGNQTDSHQCQAHGGTQPSYDDIRVFAA
jgi:chromosome partitioning protein